MTDQIITIDKPLEYTLEINVKAPMWKMPMVVGGSYKTIMAYMECLGIESSGAPYVRYLNLNWDALSRENKFITIIKMFTRKWNMLVGFPVAEKVDGNEIIQSGVLPGGSYLKTMHIGPYQNVGKTYKKIMDKVNNDNITIKNESLEIYLNDPRTTNKEELQTAVLVPLAQ